MSGSGVQTGMTRAITNTAPVKIRRDRLKEQTVLYVEVAGAANIRVYERLIVIAFFRPAKSSPI